MSTYEDSIAALSRVPWAGPAPTVPAGVDRLAAGERTLLREDAATWISQAGRARAVLTALVRAHASSYDPHYTVMRDLLARFMITAARSGEWIRVMGFAISRVEGWVETCESIVDEDAAARPEVRDLRVRLAQMWIDRAVDLAGTVSSTSLLERAIALCARDEAEGRAGWTASIQRARAAYLAGRSDEAIGQIESCYRAYPASGDGFTELARLERRRSGAPAAIDLMRRDARLGRMSEAARQALAALLAQAGCWSEAVETIDPPTRKEGGRESSILSFVGAVLPDIIAAWKASGQTRHLRELLERIMGLLSTVKPSERDAPRAAVFKARCHAMLGNDRAMGDALVVLDTVAPEQRRSARAFLGAMLVVGGELRRGEALFADAEPAVMESDSYAELRLWALWSLGGRDAAFAYIEETERYRPQARGLRTHLAARLMQDLQQAWIRDHGAKAADPARTLICRELLESDTRNNRRRADTVVRLARLDVLTLNLGAAEERIRAWYSSDEEACDGYASLADLLHAAGRQEDAARLYGMENARGGPRSSASRLRHAGFLACVGDTEAAEAVVAAVCADEPLLRGARAQIAGQLMADVTRAFTAGQTTPHLAAERARLEPWLLRDGVVFRGDPLEYSNAARLACLCGDEDAGVGHIHALYKAFPLQADAFFQLGQLFRKRSGHAAVVAYAERDRTLGRLGTGASRAAIRLMTFARAEDARGVALEAGPRIRRSATEVRRCLHAIDPYDGFDHRDWPEDRRGWHSDSPIFAELIETVRPELIVEVGTWKGGSAITMARECKARDLRSHLVCVDTWLGAVEFWLNHADEERYRALALKHGFPSVYYQFLANCCHAGVADWITPFPQTSTTGALWFVLQGFQADLIYIDASHTYDDVRRDVAAYWDVLAPRGVMFGDDYPMHDVARAVHEFAGQRGLDVEVRHECWILRRPPASAGASSAT